MRRTFATAIVALLGVMLLIVVAPFAPGLVGAPVLAVVFTPLHRALARHVPPKVAAAAVLVVAVVGLLVPAVAIAALTVAQAPDILDGPSLRRLVEWLAALHFGGVAVGQQLATATGSLASWASGQLIALAGTLTRAVINLLIALVGLYYLLTEGGVAWRAVARHIPFSRTTVEHLRARFHDITEATILGIGVTALLQGTLVGVAFALVGLDNAFVWGTAAAAASVLPVLGGSLVWVPGTVVLASEGRLAAATALALAGLVVISNIDNLVRPVVFRRVSNIHPLITLVGVFAGVRYFGLPGILLGPLGLAYFFELVAALDAEYPGAARRALRASG